MRKHPLIALIAFTFAAATIFISAASASSIALVPARATSRLTSATKPSRPLWMGDLRWLTAVVRQQQAAEAQAAAQLTALRASRPYQDRAADTVAIHDIGRGPRALLPSAWRAAAIKTAEARAAAHAAAIANLKAQEQQQLLQQQQQQQQQQEQEALQAEKVAAQQRAAQQAAAAREAREAKASRDRTHGTEVPVTTTTQPVAAPNLGGVWLSLRLCESGNNYGEDTGNGFYGAYQFALSTWWGLGYSGLPSEAPAGVQDQAAERLQAEAGWDQWPACSAELGL